MTKPIICARIAIGIIATVAAVPNAMSASTFAGSYAQYPANGSGDHVDIGNDAPGSLSVNGGSQFNISSGSNPGSGPSMHVGDHLGGNGTLTVSGTNSAVNLAGANGYTSLSIGRDTAIGLATVKDGGTLLLTDTTAASGSSNTEGEIITVGREDGSGTLNVEDGGLVKIESQSGTFLHVGREGGTGTVNVSGNGQINLLEHDPDANSDGANITVGRDSGGQGTMVIQDQGQVVVDSDNAFSAVFIGRETGGNGDIIVDGPDASLTVNSGSKSRIILGQDEGTTGSLTVKNGATVSALGTEGRVNIGIAYADFGKEIAGSGNVLVTGAGSELIASDQIVVGAPGIYGGGTSSGELTVADGGAITANEIRIGAGGILNGSGGTINGDIVLDGGILAPGASPGIMNINGNLEVLDGTLDLEIAGTGPGEFDQLLISGDLIAPIGMAINLIFLDGFLPILGTEFELFDIAGDSSVLEDPAAVMYNVMSENADIMIAFGSDGNGGFGITVENVVPSVVPLPPSIVLFGAALSGLGIVTRRRRARARGN